MNFPFGPIRCVSTRSESALLADTSEGVCAVTQKPTGKRKPTETQQNEDRLSDSAGNPKQEGHSIAPS